MHNKVQNGQPHKHLVSLSLHAYLILPGYKTKQNKTPQYGSNTYAVLSIYLVL